MNGRDQRAEAPPTIRREATRPLSSSPERRVERFRLAVISGPDAGRVHLSADDRVVLGTHESCDLVLSDRSVSRFHCEIRVDDRRTRVCDLGSKNGTAVDGVGVCDAYLRHGAVIAIGRTQLRFELDGAQLELTVSSRERFGLLVGRSPAMRRVFDRLERAAASACTVLLEGETGTGKEAAAESIHRESDRRDGPFVVVDCGAIPPSLLESELLGHERGAFTGAVASRPGAFEAAHGGTVFLDEIGELAPELQPKLLRALERREVKRLGATRFQPVDVRVIAATNRDLRAGVNEGRFRADLYYRLAVLTIRLPPLRERPEDLPLLVDHLLDSIGAKGDRARLPELLGPLARHTWPGNVRELRNHLERVLVLDQAADPESGAEPASPPPPPQVAPELLARPLKLAREAWLAPFERAYAQALLERHGDNITAAARSAGVDRITFYRLLDKHRLR